ITTGNGFMTVYNASAPFSLLPYWTGFFMLIFMTAVVISGALRHLQLLQTRFQTRFGLPHYFGVIALLVFLPAHGSLQLLGRQYVSSLLIPVTVVWLLATLLERYRQRKATADIDYKLTELMQKLNLETSQRFLHVRMRVSTPTPAARK